MLQGLRKPGPEQNASGHPAYQKSYLARLNYVHQNPVKHALVPVANQYPWGSAAWFENTVSPGIVNSIYRFKMEAVRVEDDFDASADW